METIILVLLMGGMNLIAFLIGARTVQKVNKGEDIKINPIEVYKEYKEDKEVAKEQEQLNTILANINNYQGDGIGQRDIL